MKPYYGKLKGIVRGTHKPKRKKKEGHIKIKRGGLRLWNLKNILEKQEEI